MHRAGYATGLVGKWHLGLGTAEHPVDFNREIKPGPLEVGFDEAWYFPAAGGWVPCVWIENHRVVGLDPNDPIEIDTSVPRGAPETYIHDIFHIGAQGGGKAATFKYDENADTLAEKSCAFIEKHQSHPFFLYLATHDIHVPRVPHDRFHGTTQAGVRGDAVRSFDWTIGQVVETLERLGLRENTLIIVSSDNGPSLNAWDPEGVYSGNVDTNAGHAYNGPLRGAKGTSLEGGVRVPYVANWPGRINPGVSEEIISILDTMGAMAALTGQRLQDGEARDSFNILPALLGENAPPARSNIVIEGMPVGHGDRPALRDGHWKLIPADPTIQQVDGQWQGGARPWPQLFNLNDGTYEDRNLAETDLEKLGEMSELLQTLIQSPQTRPSNH